MAHRGGAGEWPENTLVAFRGAHSVGVEVFELDVQMTCDGEVIVCHDDNLSRVCGVNEQISDHTLHSLPHCLSEMEVACEPGEFMRSHSQEPLLRLEDLYKEFPRVPMQIDVKPGTSELIEKVSVLTKLYNREQITAWGAFSHSTTVHCRKYNPNMLTFCSMIECALYPLLLIIGILPFIPIRAEFYMVPIPNISNKSGFLSTYPKWFCQLITPLMCNPLLLWHLQRRGVRTGAWVLNHPAEYRTAERWGFEGVITDFPSRWREYEESKGEKKVN